jgi:hypothetical protein
MTASREAGTESIVSVVLAATGDGQATVGAVRWYGLSVLMRHDLQVGYVVLFESIEPSLRDVDAVEE